MASEEGQDGARGVPLWSGLIGKRLQVRSTVFDRDLRGPQHMVMIAP